MISGEIEYDLARNSRLDDNKCRHFGSEYTEKNPILIYLFYSV